MNFDSRFWRFLVENKLVSILVGLLSLLVLAFLIVGFCEPKWIFTFLGVSAKYEALKFLGIGMGGLLVAIQAAMSYKRAKAMEDAANAQVKANQNTEQGQRQERLKNAIEHLGHASVSVRLGGAYELFHLARDTEELRQTVLDILCAHIRRTTGEDKYREEHESKPSEEIQSLLTLLFVQDHDIFKGLRADLQESWLKGANLSSAYLQGADLQDTHMEETKFFKAHLEDANLWSAHLEGAYLQGSNLLSAHLKGASLIGAHLQCACLTAAHLQGACLNFARLQEASLDGAHLQGVGISSPSMTFAERIRDRTGEASDLSGVIFESGLSREVVDTIVEGLLDESATFLRGDWNRTSARRQVMNCRKTAEPLLESTP